MPLHRDEPPDHPEIPECCGEEMEFDGVRLRCAGACSRIEMLDPDWYPQPEPDAHTVTLQPSLKTSNPNITQ